jgi:hypothetical protein
MMQPWPIALPWGKKLLSDEPTLQPVALAYLICLNVKQYRHARGARYFDSLWHKDLIQHVRYLKTITLAFPCQEGEPPPDAMAWTALLPKISVHRPSRSPPMSCNPFCACLRPRSAFGKRSAGLK